MNDTAIRPHRGVMILVFGILGIVLCMPLGIVAWIMGSGDLKLMRAGAMDPSGEGLTQVGKILGIIGTLLGLMVVLFAIIGFLLGLLLPALAGAANNGFLLGF